MDQIIEYLKQLYDPISIIVYGSYADGTNHLNSDFDALVISRSNRTFHDTAFVDGTQLDVFIYPESHFDGNLIATISFKFLMERSFWIPQARERHSRIAFCHI